jgi:uncharacterized protein YutE (UPF0331/DUF86 family)
MKYNGIIEHKLRVIEENVENIKSWGVDSFEKLKESTLLQNAVERALQVAIEAMIDVAERILAVNKIPPRNSAAKSMFKLQELNILVNASKYEEMVRFRNFIVHRYENIDLKIIYNIVNKMLPLFHQFVDEIRKT